ncbi:hypothetical protein ACQEWB_33915 [Streptomyces sp. CA-249302]
MAHVLGGGDDFTGRMTLPRATRLGFTFGDARQWLPRAVAETLGEAD